MSTTTLTTTPTIIIVWGCRLIANWWCPCEVVESLYNKERGGDGREERER